MKLSKEGFARKVPGDVIIRSWPWQKTPGKYFSTKYGLYFKCLENYWKHVGASERTYNLKFRATGNKIEGLGTGELLKDWISVCVGISPVIILTDINVSETNSGFWKKLPVEHMFDMTKDFVILRCSSVKEVRDLVESISPKLAHAYGFAHTMMISSNLDLDR